MTKTEVKKRFYADVADILQKDDDLMPDYAEDSQEYKAWQEARNALVDELERRSQ